MLESDPEFDFLRNVEDLFAASRGIPHVLSPKDVHLARSWFTEGVPLAAVAAGITEVLEKKRAAADGDVVVSLTYCRHAVRRHAKRIAAAQAGGRTTAAQEHNPSAGDALCREICSRAEDLREDWLAVAEVLDDIASRLKAGLECPSDAVDEFVFALESEMLHRCREALPEPTRRALESQLEDVVRLANPTPETRSRVEAAHRDRLVRTLLRLPRLELP